MKNNYCVIMAGGAGTRFWPKSRSKYPKQFIDILGLGKTLLQQTFERFERICPTENILIVTSQEYKELTLEQLPQIKPSQVLCEPGRRNTAPCIAYANYRIQAENPEANIVVAPSDHLIMNEDKFVETIKTGMEFTAQNDALLTMGITPHRPDTGYGYIQFNQDDAVEGFENLTKVKTFTEKPDLETAKFFLESKEFYWNSGIFIWSLKSIQKAFAKDLEDVQSLFEIRATDFNTEKENEAIKDIYSKCRNISIDYGVMEKADNVFVLGADYGWSDLGTWNSLFEHMGKDENNNALSNNNVLLYETKNSVVHLPEDKLAVIKGLDDYIVVDTDNALLIYPKSEEQQVKLIVNDIKTNKGEQFV